MATLPGEPSYQSPGFAVAKQVMAPLVAAVEVPFTRITRDLVPMREGS